MLAAQRGFLLPEKSSHIVAVVWFTYICSLDVPLWISSGQKRHTVNLILAAVKPYLDTDVI